MPKNQAEKTAAPSAQEALGGEMVPMPPQMLAAAPPEKARHSRPQPTEEELKQKIAVQRIGRPPPGVPGNGSGTVMIAGVGAVAAPAAPAFLGGLSPEKKEARRLIAAVQRDLGVAIAQLSRSLPGIVSNLAALALIDMSASTAADEGVDLIRAADVARELQEALDRAAK